MNNHTINTPDIKKNSPQQDNQLGANGKDKLLQAHYNPKSTSTADQRAKLLGLLRIKPRSTQELRENGIYAPAPRIMELRAKGHEIITTKENLMINGYFHKGIAIYVLLKEANNV